mmetsp:Transcript_64488/g.153974  ORF Transcript_64488/g.153974 Transcript_64488/m.153974 type:complete len:457 (+) Transcript_64488:83-1453(+)
MAARSFGCWGGCLVALLVVWLIGVAEILLLFRIIGQHADIAASPGGLSPGTLYEMVSEDLQHAFSAVASPENCSGESRTAASSVTQGDSTASSTGEEGWLFLKDIQLGLRQPCSSLQAAATQFHPLYVPPGNPHAEVRLRRDSQVRAKNLWKEWSCDIAWANCKQLFNASDNPLKHINRKNYSKFMHLTKTGGKTIEDFMEINFMSHDCLWYPSKLGGKSIGNGALEGWITMVRHPIERLASDYFFKLTGERQFDWERQQAMMCQNGTGRAFKNKCIPKVSLFEYGNSSDKVMRVRGEDNYQFHCLQPKRNPPLNVWQMRKFLTTNFALIGTTDQMPIFQLMVAQAFGLNKRKVKNTRLNTVPHSAVEELLTEEEYEILAKRNINDMWLYYWALDHVELLKRCYGEAKLARELAEVNRRSGFQEDITKVKPKVEPKGPPAKGQGKPAPNVKRPNAA